MPTAPLNMQQVAQRMEQVHEQRARADRVDALREKMLNMQEEIDRLAPYAQLLTLPATKYLLRTLAQPENARLLRREMFPHAMLASATYHANGPLVQTLWACAGLDPNLPEPTPTALSSPFDLQARLASALLAHRVVEMTQELRYRLDSTPPRPMTPTVQEVVHLSGFNSPEFWIQRFHGLRQAARLQVDNNIGEREALMKVVQEVENATRAAASWESVCRQVPAKLALVQAQLQQCREQMQALVGSEATIKASNPVRSAPWVREQEMARLPVVVDAPHGAFVPPAELRALVGQQRKLLELGAERARLLVAAEGEKAFHGFLQGPVAQFVLESLLDLDLAHQVFVEFDPISFQGTLEYHLQSPTLVPTQAVALGMLMEAVRTIDPEFDFWAQLRPDEGAPGLMTCIAGAVLALNCGRLHELLVLRMTLPGETPLAFTPAQNRSLLLSGFAHPVVWEKTFCEIGWMVDSRAPLTMAALPMDIPAQADRLLTVEDLSAQTLDRAGERQAKLAQVEREIEAVRQQIAASVAGFEMRFHDTTPLRDLEGAQAGRLLMARLMGALGPQCAEPESASNC